MIFFPQVWGFPYKKDGVLMRYFESNPCTKILFVGMAWNYFFHPQGIPILKFGFFPNKINLGSSPKSNRLIPIFQNYLPSLLFLQYSVLLAWVYPFFQVDISGIAFDSQLTFYFFPANYFVSLHHYSILVYPYRCVEPRSPSTVPLFTSIEIFSSLIYFAKGLYFVL